LLLAVAFPIFSTFSSLLTCYRAEKFLGIRVCRGIVISATKDELVRVMYPPGELNFYYRQPTPKIYVYHDMTKVKWNWPVSLEGSWEYNAACMHRGVFTRA
jgi:hypothetical protein